MPLIFQNIDREVGREGRMGTVTFRELDTALESCLTAESTAIIRKFGEVLAIIVIITIYGHMCYD